MGLSLSGYRIIFNFATSFSRFARDPCGVQLSIFNFIVIGIVRFEHFQIMLLLANFLFFFPLAYNQ